MVNNTNMIRSNILQTSAVSTGLGLSAGTGVSTGLWLGAGTGVSTGLGLGEPGAGTGGRESLCGAAACGYDGAYHIRTLVSNTGI